MMSTTGEVLIGQDGQMFGRAPDLDIQRDQVVTSLGETLHFAEAVKPWGETAAERTLAELLIARLSDAPKDAMVADAQLCATAVRAAFDALTG